MAKRFRAEEDDQSMGAFAPQTTTPPEAPVQHEPSHVGPSSASFHPLLLEACQRYGVDPSDPKQLLAHRVYAANRDLGLPERCTIVTAGGAKVTWPVDDETRARLVDILALTVKQKDGSIVTQPLPDDLTLPARAIAGKAHGRNVHRGGYLRQPQ